MKSKLLCLITLGASILSTVAAQPTNAPAAALPIQTTKVDWFSGFSISPFGALNHPDLKGPLWGVGFDVGKQINKHVSIHVANLVYDLPGSSSSGSGEGDWKKKSISTSSSSSDEGWTEGPAIDESSLLFRGDFFGVNKDSGPVLFLVGGGDRDWVNDIWGLSVGGGAGWKFTKNFSLEADVRIRAWFKEREKDLPARAYLNWKF